MSGDRKYRWKRKPYHHQVAAVKFLLQNGWGGALLMEPRTGKTKVAIDYLSILHQFHGVNRVLMIGPVVAIQVWKEQLEANCPYPYRITVWDRKGRKRIELPKYGKDILDIVLMNYDAFSTPGAFMVHRSGPNKGEPILDKNGQPRRSKSRGGRFDMKKQIKLWSPQIIILDESHRIKSPSAKKSTAIHSLARIPDYKLLLTGTVVTKSKRLFDVYSQWKFLNPERFAGMNFTEFKHTYGRFVAQERYEKYLGPKNVEQLHDLIHMDAFSVTREECFDLPRQTTQIIPVQLTTSAKAYDEMAEEMIAQIHTGEITEASIRLVQSLRLQQITSGVARTIPSPAHPKGRLVRVGTEKLDMIESRLEDLMEADEKVVIGALYKHDIAALEALGKKLRVPTFSIHGGVKMKDRGAIPGKFNKVSGGAIFIGQPAAAGEAIDLSAASIMQWYSLPRSWVNYRQFTDRIALSEKPTFYEYYLAMGTIDFHLFDTLQEDGDIGKRMIQSPDLLRRLGQEFE